MRTQLPAVTYWVRSIGDSISVCERRLETINSGLSSQSLSDNVGFKRISYMNSPGSSTHSAASLVVSTTASPPLFFSCLGQARHLVHHLPERSGAVHVAHISLRERLN